MVWEGRRSSPTRFDEAVSLTSVPNGTVAAEAGAADTSRGNGGGGGKASPDISTGRSPPRQRPLGSCGEPHGGPGRGDGRPAVRASASAWRQRPCGARGIPRPQVARQGRREPCRRGRCRRWPRSSSSELRSCSCCTFTFCLSLRTIAPTLSKASSAEESDRDFRPLDKDEKRHLPSVPARYDFPCRQVDNSSRKFAPGEGFFW